MTQRKMQSQVEEEDMLEENRPEVLRMEIESLSRNEEFARVVVSVFMARMNPTLEELDDVKTAVSEAVTNAVIHGYQGNGGIIYLEVKILGQELTAANLAIVFSIGNSFGFVTMIGGGFLNQKLGVRRVVFLGGVLFGIGFVICGFAQNVSGLVIGYGLVAGLAMGLAYG